MPWDDFELRLSKKFIEQKEWEGEVDFNQEIDTRPTEKRFELKRFGILRLFALAIFFLLGWRLFALQIIAGASYQKEAEGNRMRTFAIPAPRGIIYDRSGKILVRNIPSFQIIFVPADLPAAPQEREEFLSSLAAILAIDQNELKESIAEAPADSYEPRILVRNLDREKALLIDAQLAHIPGLLLTSFPVREYPETNLVAHLLGYTGKISKEEYAARKQEGYFLTDSIGKQGVELTYEEVLRGQSGQETVEVDARGRVEKVLGLEPPQPGKSIKLALDLDLQKKVFGELQEALAKKGVSKGAAVAIDPQTGHILAMVSIPDFDNNLFARGISNEDFARLRDDSDKPLFQRAISGEYPPGSTIKPLIGIAALEEGVIRPNHSLHCPGSLIYHGFGDTVWTFPDWKAHGSTDLRKAIAESCDVYFYTLGGGSDVYGITGLGIERIKNWEEIFSLNKPTGVDLPGEASGLVPSPAWKEEVKSEQWYIGDTYHASIGQGDILVTPLQIAHYIAIIANGGTAYRPLVAYSFLDETTRQETEIPPTVLGTNLAQADNITLVREGMRDAVRYGSARALNDLPIEVAGKTGTAQFAGGGEKTHAWFVGFAPFVKPQISLVILAEGGGDGDKVAVPIAQNILKWYFEDHLQE